MTASSKNLIGAGDFQAWIPANTFDCASRKTLDQKLSISAPVIQRSDSGLIIGAMGTRARQDLLSLYNHDSSRFLNSLEGEGLVIVVDPERKKMLLATDRMGRAPVYYTVCERGISLSSNLQRLPEFRRNDVNIDHQAIYDYVYFHMIPSPLTIEKGVCKLGAAEALEYDGGSVSRQLYWQPVFNGNPRSSKKECYSQLRQHLKQAVTCAAEDSGKVGAFLSGGLDSSTVAGMLRETQGHCEAYAIGFHAEGYDEMEYARLTARHFDISLHEYYVTPEDVLEALPKVAASTSEPFGNSSVLPAYFCAQRAAADGIETLLAGDGGDELFAGNERYAKQKIFERWMLIPAPIRSHLVEPAVQTIPDKLSIGRKARSYIQQANIPLPDRLYTYSFLERNEPEMVFSRAFLEQVNTEHPLNLLRSLYHQPTEADSLDRMLYLDWQITLADNDLRKVNHGCELAGVSVKYPMLDDELVQFSTRIPTEWKLPRNRLRDFYKKALTGWLPDATIHKEKHGFGLPFGIWMQKHKPLRELAYSCISDLGGRNIFNPDFLEKILREHKHAHASYFGELIWVLTTLELWLKAHFPSYSHD